MLTSKMNQGVQHQGMKVALKSVSIFIVIFKLVKFEIIGVFFWLHKCWAPCKCEKLIRVRTSIVQTRLEVNLRCGWFEAC